MDIIAITVSTEYEDYLSLALQENCKFFKKRIQDTRWFFLHSLCFLLDYVCTNTNNGNVGR